MLSPDVFCSLRALYMDSARYSSQSASKLRGIEELVDPIASVPKPEMLDKSHNWIHYVSITDCIPANTRGHFRSKQSFKTVMMRQCGKRLRRLYSPASYLSLRDLCARLRPSSKISRDLASPQDPKIHRVTSLCVPQPTTTSHMLTDGVHQRIPQHARTFST